jgi:hypothetical protein
MRNLVIYLVIFLVILLGLSLAGCTKDVKPSSNDITMARCICKLHGSDLLYVQRHGGDGLYLECVDKSHFHHPDTTYTEGCK